MEQFQINEKSNVVYIFSLIFFVITIQEIKRKFRAHRSRKIPKLWNRIELKLCSQLSQKLISKIIDSPGRTKLYISSTIKTQMNLILWPVLGRLDLGLRTVPKMSAILIKHPIFEFFLYRQKSLKVQILKPKSPSDYSSSFLSCSKQLLYKGGLWGC